MTATQARNVLVGTVVMWNDNPEDLGTVRSKTPDGMFVDWENDRSGWFSYKDCKRINVR